MFAFTEPPRTNYDLHFSLFGIPVRIHPLFWAISGLFGWGITNGGQSVLLLIWIGSVFLSILIHELGHAMVMRYYGWNPHIVLHGMGGLAIRDHRTSNFGTFDAPRNQPSVQIIISAAGPIAGFLLAIFVILLVNAIGPSQVLINFKGGIRFWELRQLTGNALPLVHFLLFINVYWGLLNLLPVYPLDGGQIARELFQIIDPTGGIPKSLWLSIFAAATAALYGFQSNSLFLSLMFAFMAYSNFQILTAYRGGGPLGGHHGGGSPW